MSQTPLEHTYKTVNGLQLHCVQMGKGPLALFLQGFPDCWYCWKHQMPYVAQLGYKTLALDLRGCNLSEKPPKKHDYDPWVIVEDIRHLIEQEGRSCVLFGSGLGGLYAQLASMKYPNLITKLILINAPHPTLYAKYFLYPAQFARAWYVLFHQLPWLPSFLWKWNNSWALRHHLHTRLSNPSVITEEDEKVFVEAFRQPGAIDAMLNYYRTIGVPFIFKKWKDCTPLHQPTLYCWSQKHVAMHPMLLKGIQQWIPHIDLRVLPDQSSHPHWCVADQINEDIGEFLSKP